MARRTLRNTVLSLGMMAALACSPLQKTTTLPPESVEQVPSVETPVDNFVTYMGGFEGRHIMNKGLGVSSSGELGYMYEIYAFNPTVVDSFISQPGAMVKASKQEGLQALTLKAKVDTFESSWMRLPEYDLWINNVLLVGAMGCAMDPELTEHILDSAKQVEFWHTHTDYDYHNWFDKAFRDSIGPALFFLPSRTDVTATIYNANYFLGKEISSGVASSTASMSITALVFDTLLCNPTDVSGLLRYFSTREYIDIRDHMFGTPPDSLESRANSYSGDVKLNIEYLPKND